MDRGASAVTAARSVVRQIDLLERLICETDHDYPAYREDPIEANLHELGHVVTARGGLDRALFAADHGHRIGVDSFCGELRHPDRNEYNAIAFTLIVCRAIDHVIDEDMIIRKTNVSATASTYDKHRAVAKSLRDPRIVRIAEQFIALITE